MSETPAYAFFASQQFGMIVDQSWNKEMYDIEYDSHRITISPPFRLGSYKFRGRPVFTADNVNSVFPTFDPKKVMDPGIVLLSKSDGTLQPGVPSDDKDPILRHFPDAFVFCVHNPVYEEAAEIASHFCSRFYTWLRAVCRQFWIGRSMGRNAGIFFHMPVDQSGGMRGSYINQSTEPLYHGGASYQRIDQKIWTYCAEAAATGELPEPLATSTMDLDYLVASDAMVSALILGCAIIEQVRDDLVERKKIQKFKQTDLLRHLSSDMERLVGRNLKTEHPDLYQRLTLMWGARGQLAHGKAFKGVYPVSMADFLELGIDVGATTREVAEWINDIL